MVETARGRFRPGWAAAALAVVAVLIYAAVARDRDEARDLDPAPEASTVAGASPGGPAPPLADSGTQDEPAATAGSGVVVLEAADGAGATEDGDVAGAENPATGSAEAETALADAAAPEAAEGSDPAGAAGGAGEARSDSAAADAAPQGVGSPGTRAAGAQPQREERKGGTGIEPAVAPRFDLVRVAPDGAALVAGRASPGARVEVLAGDAILAEVEADASGAFVAMFRAEPATAPQALMLSARDAQGETLVSRESVLLLPPPGGEFDVAGNADSAAGAGEMAGPAERGAGDRRLAAVGTDETAPAGRAGGSASGSGREAATGSGTGRASGAGAPADGSATGATADTGGDAQRIAGESPDALADTAVAAGPEGSAESGAAEPVADIDVARAETGARGAGGGGTMPRPTGPVAAPGDETAALPLTREEGPGSAGGTGAPAGDAGEREDGSLMVAGVGASVLSAPDGAQGGSDNTRAAADGGTPNATDDAAPEAADGAARGLVAEGLTADAAGGDVLGPIAEGSTADAGGGDAPGVNVDATLEAAGGAMRGPVEEGLVADAEGGGASGATDGAALEAAGGNARGPVEAGLTADAAVAPGVTEGAALEAAGSAVGELVAEGLTADAAGGGAPRVNGNAAPDAAGGAAPVLAGEGAAVAAMPERGAVPAVPEAGGPAVAAAVILRPDGVEAVPLDAAQGASTRPVTLASIAYAEEDRVTLAGEGIAGTRLRAYVDDAFAREALVGADGRWQIELDALARGRYRLRVDALDAEGAVASRVETPFQREYPLLAGDGPLPATVTVQPGNNLWTIARVHYGAGMQYVQIFTANRKMIRDPDLIYPGQIFALPEVQER